MDNNGKHGVHKIFGLGVRVEGKDGFSLELRPFKKGNVLASEGV
jgi:hypothetical protein